MKHLIPAFLSAAVSLGVAIAATITGTAKGADGSNITGAVAIASYVASGPSVAQKTRKPVTAAVLADGTFQLASLDVGEYGICVAPPLFTGWIGSCEWGGNGTTVSLTQNQPSAAVSVVLAKGAPVNLRVNDPSGHLAANEGKTPGAHLLVGVAMPNMGFRLAAVVSQDAAGRTYQVVVPFDRSVVITAGSAFFQLADSTGKALPRLGNVFPVLVPSGQQPPTLTLNLTGTAQP